jgi:hypothetical protein
MSGITTTFAPTVSALTPHADDVAVIRAALAYLFALLAAPIRRIRQAEREARLERHALAARRAALLSRSAPSGLAPIPLASVPVAPIADVQLVTVPASEGDGVAYASADRVPYALADGYLFTVRRERCLTSLCASACLTVAEPIQPAAPPALIDPPAAPAKRTRKAAAPKKPTARKATVKKAANPPADPPAKPARKRTAKPKADAPAPTPVKAPRKRTTKTKASK